MTKVKIVYSGFFDAPLAFVTTFEGHKYLFWRGWFDDRLDDYPREYEVFTLPDLSESEIRETFSNLVETARACIGTVPVNQVAFDPTKRESIDISTFDRIDRSSSQRRKE